MSESKGAPGRRPTAFRLDDPQVLVAEPLGDSDAVRARGPRPVVVTPEPELPDSLLPVAAAPTRRRRRIPWAWLFWSAAGGLVSMGIGIAVTRFIEDLFARSDWLGWAALALAVLAAVALLAITAREAIGLSRLAEVERLRARAATAFASDDRDGARAVTRELLVFAQPSPALAHGRAGLERNMREIIDGADLLRLAERELMTPLDAQARLLVTRAAKRVSVVTAVSPRAAVDLVFVFITAIRLIRALAELYGGRPGTLGLLRLFRMVIGHLAVTGGMAAGDSIVSQMLGHGVAAKLSAKLGEGVLNGLLTARLGLAAIEVARPLPFIGVPAPTITELAGGLLRRPGGGDETGRAETLTPG